MRRFCVCGGITGASLLASATALATPTQPGEFGTEPPSGIIVVMGSGYDSLRDTWVTSPCVTIPQGAVTDAPAPPPKGSEWSVANNQSDVSNAFKLSANAQVKASMGVASISASDKASFANGVKTGHTSQTIVGSWSSTDPSKVLLTNYGAGVTIDLHRWADPVAFRAACGDYMVVGMETGHDIYGTATLDVTTTQQMNGLANDSSVGFSSGMISASAGVAISNSSSSSVTDSTLTLKIWNTDRAPQPHTITDFIQIMTDFSNGQYRSPSPPVVQLVLQPYFSAVANYPPAWVPNPLIDTPQAMIDGLTLVAWELQSLIADSQHLIDNSNVHIPDAQNILGHNLYAIGTTDAKRAARLTYMRSRNAWYRAQLTQLQNAFKNDGCQAAASGAWPQACSDLYAGWDTFDPDAEYEQFPLPYASQCYTGTALPGVPAGPGSVSIETAFFPHPFTVNRGASDGDAPGPYAFPLTTHARGDKEMGGGPVNVRASIAFGIDMAAGGNIDEAVALLGTLTIIAEENKDDHTTFERTVPRQPIFYLNGSNGQPPQQPGALGTYGECAFRHGGSGVKLAARDGLHGHLSAMSGTAPRGFSNYRGTQWGDITSVSCQVDSDSGDDSSIMGCNGATFDTVQLDLVDKEDELADTWTPPPQAGGRVPMVAVRHAHRGPDPLLTHSVPRITRRAATPVTCPPNTHAVTTSRASLCAPNAVR